MQEYTAREYLKIDIANNFGLDKLTWHQRIAWFDQNEGNLHALVQQAEEPALFYAGVKAWGDALAGRPSGYLISLDATSSGLQLLAALTGDRKAAQLCNVVSTGKREDAYTGIYNRMVEEIGDSSKIAREPVKDAVMTSLYGSKAMPKLVFGEGKLLDTFYHTMRQSAPAAWELNEAFLTMWDPEVLMHSWVLPDNFHVHVKVMSSVKETVHFLNAPYDVFYNVNAPVSEGRSLGANTIHSIDGMIVRELVRRCDYDPSRIVDLYRMVANAKPTIIEETNKDDEMVLTLWEHYQNTGYLSARILDHISEENIGLLDALVITELLDSLPKKPFKVVTIHDCFRVLPAYGNDLRRQYNLQLQLIAKSSLLSSIITDIVGKKVRIGKLDPTLAKDIIDTDYALS